VKKTYWSRFIHDGEEVFSYDPYPERLFVGEYLAGSIYPNHDGGFSWEVIKKRGERFWETLAQSRQDRGIGLSLAKRRCAAIVHALGDIPLDNRSEKV
jgi:hypothetical protein